MKIFIAIALAACTLSPAFAQANVGVSIGINQPGVYGRIDIGACCLGHRQRAVISVQRQRRTVVCRLATKTFSRTSTITNRPKAPSSISQPRRCQVAIGTIMVTMQAPRPITR